MFWDRDMSILNYNSLGSVSLTDAALSKIASLKKVNNDPNAMLKLSVHGGGCAGFKYEFEFASLPFSMSDEDEGDDFMDEDDEDYDEDDDFEDDEDSDEDDDFEDDEDSDEDDDFEDDEDSEYMALFDSNNLPVLLLDKRSKDMLSGAVIDYVESLNGSSFCISNPSAKSRCGCGTSFSI